MFYDSMIAKLIVHGNDRADAIAKMREALDGFVIRGISQQHPVPGGAARASATSSSGDFNTGFIAEHYPHGFDAEDGARTTTRVPASRWRRRSAASSMRALGRHQRAAAGPRGQGRRATSSRWCTTPTARHAQHAGALRAFDGAPAQRGSTVDGQTLPHRQPRARSRDMRHRTARSTAGPSSRRSSAARRATSWPTASSHDGARIEVTRAVAARRRAVALDAAQGAARPSKFLLSPMPGLLVAGRRSQPGQHVQAGERLAVIEAMKMENILDRRAGRRGRASRRAAQGRERSRSTRSSSSSRR